MPQGDLSTSMDRNILSGPPVGPTIPSDIGTSVIKIRNEKPVKIEDVAKVKIGHPDQIGDAYLDREPAVILTILKQPKVNTLQLTEKIDQALHDLDDYPSWSAGSQFLHLQAGRFHQYSCQQCIPGTAGGRFVCDAHPLSLSAECANHS